MDRTDWIVEIIITLPGFPTISKNYFPTYQGDSANKAEHEAWGYLEEKWGRFVVDALEKYIGVYAQPG